MYRPLLTGLYVAWPLVIGVVVAGRLGHADPAVTLRVYGHVIRRHADGVAATFAAAVDGTTPAVTEESDEDRLNRLSANGPCMTEPLGQKRSDLGVL
ncbi:MAG TPA: hypothetical protein VMT27_05120, partial [Actinomycetes bacterium]|nr:hypothetical protein [Actinomycetes bacterium]